MFGIIQDINKSLELNAYNANKEAYKKVQEAYDTFHQSLPLNYLKTKPFVVHDHF